MRKLILILSIFIVAVHCGRKDKTNNSSDTAADNILLYEEGDTLRWADMPTHIQNWIRFYQPMDAGFTLGHFKASGVNLHIAELASAISKGNDQTFRTVHFYSPDHKKFIDLFSYNYFFDKGKYITGEVDQQVVLGNNTDSSKKQLMYFGPSQLAESAGWLNDQSFLLAITEQTEEKKVKAEILLFNLKDSLYTNFQLDHLIPAETFYKKNKKFAETYLNKNNP